MKFKLNKQFIVGLVLGLSLSITVTAVAATKILSSEYNDVTVSLNGQSLTLEQPLVSVVDEANPGYFSNYMPLAAVLEKLGYTIAWDGTNRNIELTKAETVSSSPSAESTASMESAKSVRVTVDGQTPATKPDVKMMEVTGDDGETDVYILDEDILMALQTKDLPYEGNYDAAAGTYVITTKPPFIEGKPLREVMDATGSTYDVAAGTGVITIEMKLGSASATVTLDESKGNKGVVVCGGTKAEFDFYLSSGTTYIVEASFIQALKDVGFLK